MCSPIVMVNVLKPKVQATGLMDTFELAILKTLSEKALTPVVGNGTFMSGAAKLVGGGVLTSVSRNKHVGLLGSALVVDGVEDAAHSLLGSVLGGTTTGAPAWNQ